MNDIVFYIRRSVQSLLLIRAMLCLKRVVFERRRRQGNLGEFGFVLTLETLNQV